MQQPPPIPKDLEKPSKIPDTPKVDVFPADEVEEEEFEDEDDYFISEEERARQENLRHKKEALDKGMSFIEPMPKQATIDPMAGENAWTKCMDRSQPIIPEKLPYMDYEQNLLSARNAFQGAFSPKPYSPSIVRVEDVEKKIAPIPTPFNNVYGQELFRGVPPESKTDSLLNQLKMEMKINKVVVKFICVKIQLVWVPFSVSKKVFQMIIV